MPERYAPPEARGKPAQNTSESKSGFFDVFKKYADKKLVSLALATGIFFGSMSGAEARKAQTDEPEGGKDQIYETREGDKYKVLDKKIVDTKGGTVHYLVAGCETVFGEERGNQYYTVLDIHDEGNPDHTQFNGTVQVHEHN